VYVHEHEHERVHVHEPGCMRGREHGSAAAARRRLGGDSAAARRWLGGGSATAAAARTAAAGSSSSSSEDDYDKAHGGSLKWRACGTDECATNDGCAGHRWATHATSADDSARPRDFGGWTRVTLHCRLGSGTPRPCPDTSTHVPGRAPPIECASQQPIQAAAARLNFMALTAARATAGGGQADPALPLGEREHEPK